MPQKTNLNVSPYYDDFDKEDNYYKVLFKPGFPVQARELTGLQSILQNQIESFGSHIFKEGSMVIPGGITCDNEFTTVKINPTHLGIDVTVYLDALSEGPDGAGTKVIGENSKVVGRISGYLLPPEEGVEDITLFIKYRDGADDGEGVELQDGEVLVLDENISYGNTSLRAGDTVATLVSSGAANTGYSVGVAEGVYFIRGTFVDVLKEKIVLDPYDNQPSFRVGFDIVEEIINSNEDEGLNDNAKGFTNYAAPGADRLKISVKLAKKQLTDIEDINFIELVKVDEGEIKKLQNKSDYNLIKDYFAKRTFEESGNYAIDNFIVEASECLNDEKGNGGLFRKDEVTEQGNTPSEDLLALKISAGTAYVKGYDIDLVGSTVIDVPKPRTTKTVPTAAIPFAMGSLLKINNVAGVPYINIGDTSAGGANSTSSNIIELYKERRNHNGITNITDAATAGLNTKIGEARVYWYGLADDTYKGNATQWDLYLYDIQTYTEITLSNTYNTSDVPDSSYVRGLSSGATGYIDDRSANVYQLIQTSGTFLEGESVIINEQTQYQSGITTVTEYTTDDIKAVFQDADALNTDLQTNFIADTVLHERTLPNFSKTDLMNISGSGSTRTGQVGGRFFSGVTGIKLGRTIKYQNGNADPIYSDITAIAANGTSISLTVPTTALSGVYRATHTNGNYTFSMMVPKIINFGSTGLYSHLPVENIASVDLAQASLKITKQINLASFSGNSFDLAVSDAISASAGINSVFYTPFDAERYSIHYSDGTTEKLTSGKFSLGPNGDTISFSGLDKASDSNVSVIVTLDKRNVTNKTKDYIRSQSLVVSRTKKNNAAVGLDTSSFYGTRIEDDQISLNVPDVMEVCAVYESTDENDAVLDKLTFQTGLNLDVNSIIGEKLVGSESRAIAYVHEKTANTITYVPKNANTFIVGETVTFESSAISAPVQEVTKGSYVDLSANYRLDTGHRNDYCDYSRIIRRPGSPTPSKRLTIIFDAYQVGSENQGDLFTVNSYAADRFKSDIPSLPSGLRVTNTLDFRPRVKPFTSTTASPFAFDSREYESTYRYIITPDEASYVGYSYYLPRIDLVALNRLGEVEVVYGDPADVPQAPILADDAMELAEISYPPYLFNPDKEPRIVLKDNRRFTMRDIGKLEDRIENLEEVTSLSMLELNAKTLAVTDANGLDRFKSGFIVSDFRDRSLFDERLSTIDIDKENAAGIAPVDLWSMNAELALDASIDVSQADLSQNLKLADSSIQKAGDLVTLKFSEVGYIEQPHATHVENVNPFEVVTFVGGVQLDPASDNWTRTIYINDHRTESTGAKWKQIANVTQNVDRKVTRRRYKKGGGRGETGVRRYVTTTITTKTKYTPKLEGPSREFDYVESVKVSGEADPWMRERNVYFNANGLRPFTKHYHYLDSQQVDLVPKLCEMKMVSGTFQVFENADIFDSTGKKIGFIKLQRPNHKYGDETRPDIGAGLGSPSVLVEKYQVDPFDRDRPAPGSTYSPTSRLINFCVRILSTQQKFYGYVEKNAKVVGRTSGAVARLTNVSLMSDNWGDVIANFYFRNPNANPKPPIRVKSGTKTVKVTALPPNTAVLPGSTKFASEAIGTYSGSGTILTQRTKTVAVRNPPRPRAKKTEIDVKVKAPHRDPLAQSFTVDGRGIFLTSFDLFFASKDPDQKVFVELRTMELGTPTQYLVQDYTQVALNPSDIQVSKDGSVPTRVRFPSPVYLAPDTEYAIVILAPASVLYEMFIARMGSKTLKTSNLPDVQNVVVGKQYIGGSLFKSQNGTIWTPSQFEDLTFKLYKAKFKKKGTLTWHNSDISPKGTNSAALTSNPIEGLPRKLKVGISGTLNANVVLGTKIGEGAIGPSITGFIENIGAPISTIDVTDRGSGYAVSQSGVTGIQLFSMTGKGTGGVATINTNADGEISSVTITNAGSGYVEGEVVGLTTSSFGATIRQGSGAKVTISGIGVTDTFYLTDVQGENFTNSESLFFFTDPTDESTRTNSGVSVNGASELVDNKYSGNVFRIKQFNHAHHGGNNKIEIIDVEPDTTRTVTTARFTEADTTVAVANTSIFASFEGITTSRGYALIDNEVVGYSGINAGNAGAGTLSIDQRSLQNTVKSIHNKGVSIQPYEVNGVSLTRINKVHDIPSTEYYDGLSNIDTYFLEVDRSLQSPSVRDAGAGYLNFRTESGFGGNTVGISQNYQFSVLTPQFNVITPGKGTAITCNLRTISGTSSGGNEVSFIDQGFETVTLNKPIYFNTPRMVASEVNETERLTTLPRNKSLTLRVDFTTEDENLSPMMDVQNATFILGRNKANDPISDYINDPRANQIDNDPHSSVLVTKKISLAQPASSLKVLVAAHRQESADFRVFYQLFRADSSEVEQKFIAFPGYDNTFDDDGDGFGDRVKNPNKNSGRADAYVDPNGQDIEDYSEYQFSVDNLDQFTAFAIKIVMSTTNESAPVRLKDFRAIALA